MNKLLLPSIAAVFAVAISHAAPTDDVKAAVKKLADAPNYSWSTTTANAGGQGGGFGGGAVSGKAEKDGITLTTRETPNGSMQIVTKGDKVVMQNQEGAWVTREEMMAQFGGGGGGPQGGPPRGGPGGGQGGNRGGGRGGFGFGGGAGPAVDAVALVDEAKDLKSADGVISGDLTPQAVGQHLSFGRGGRGGPQGGGTPPPPPANASGSVKFWVKDGALVKYEVHVKGTVQGRNGEMEVDRTTTTEIKDVGTTKVEVPAEAKKKLDA